ncbi:hypothetical protein H4R26_001134 [Coemansia thaxteri]|uniref:Ubiquitin-like domain-containing protein n=1 Tax=Coemansia thaxteri TaxID=2663907 RepID=A0A9W8ELG3_9FUNG|nr:hypothetical protein H4R26_001134 [Coemansia thaxteri]
MLLEESANAVAAADAAVSNSNTGSGAATSEMQMHSQALSATSHERKSDDISNDNDSNFSAGRNNMTGDVRITFLMVSGEKGTRVFTPDDTVLHAKETLAKDWPDNFGNKPATPLNLRILYLGHFLDDSATLRAKKDIDKAPKCTCIIL